LPDDPALAAWASALNEAGHSAWLLDATWRFVFATDELRLSWGKAEAALPIGFHYFSAEAAQFRAATYGGLAVEREFRRARFVDIAGYMLAATPAGREELRRVVDPELADLVDDLQSREVPLVRLGLPTSTRVAGMDVAGGFSLVFRIDDGRGRLAGFCVLIKPQAGMSHLAAVSYTADLAHLERMRAVEEPDRRPAAILMADLEASSPLARRLSSAQYFEFVRHLVRAADDFIIDAGGIVGRHAGDGVVAFFLAETAVSESSAAKANIMTARRLRVALVDIAERSGLPDGELCLHFGLHWGSTVYMGRILTRGRSEVTCLGDEMNEAARIEACATGGRTLASKALIERLDRADAELLGIDAAHVKYTLLSDLSTATDKARRDAPSIAVCEL
jgi:class 3 adenylate cyclase